jgi:hypothetical protein
MGLAARGRTGRDVQRPMMLLILLSYPILFISQKADDSIAPVASQRIENSTDWWEWRL